MPVSMYAMSCMCDHNIERTLDYLLVDVAAVIASRSLARNCPKFYIFK